VVEKAERQELRSLAINLSLVLRRSTTKSDESRQIKVKLATPATPTQLCSAHKYPFICECVRVFALLLNISFPPAQVELHARPLGMQNEALPVSGLQDFGTPGLSSCVGNSCRSPRGTTAQQQEQWWKELSALHTSVGA